MGGRVTTGEITGGMTMIDGTAYKITGGKTMIDGTVYDISFGGGALTWDAILSDATITAAYRNTSTTTANTPTAASPSQESGVYYLIAARGGIGVCKIRSDTLTNLYTTDVSTSAFLPQAVQGYYDGSSLYYSLNGTRSAAVQSGVILKLEFASYSDDELDAAFAALAVTVRAGQSGTSNATISLSASEVSDGDYYIAELRGYWCIARYSTGDIMMYAGNPTSGYLIYENGSTIALSTAGTGTSSTRGGTLFFFAEIEA